MKTFSEKLIALRRQAGCSQEQLADRLGVTRQSVSKWESGSAMPELPKLIALSELFSVSIDYLVKDQLEEPEAPEASGVSTAKLEKQVEEITSYFRTWEWTSKTKLFGLPLVSVCFSLYPHIPHHRKAARGIIAIGNIAARRGSSGIAQRRHFQRRGYQRGSHSHRRAGVWNGGAGTGSHWTAGVWTGGLGAVVCRRSSGAGRKNRGWGCGSGRNRRRL